MFHEMDVLVSLFIEPDISVVERSKDSGADYIEIHTGTYCTEADTVFFKTGELRWNDALEKEIRRIYRAAEHATQIGIGVNAGHGLNIYNLSPVLKASGLDELNIGHSIISRSIFAGLAGAVQELLDIIKEEDGES
jgi:pyridoxine 5-phosphate synthase